MIQYYNLYYFAGELTVEIVVGIIVGSILTVSLVIVGVLLWQRMRRKPEPDHDQLYLNNDNQHGVSFCNISDEISVHIHTLQVQSRK